MFDIIFNNKPKIQYQIKECVETGIIVTGVNEVGGTFDVIVDIKNTSDVTRLYDKILDLIDKLDHSTISDDSKISDFNKRYFVIDPKKIDIFKDSVTIFGYTLVSLFNLYELTQYIDSVTVTLNKKSIRFSSRLHRINCIWSFSE